MDEQASDDSVTPVNRFREEIEQIYVDRFPHNHLNSTEKTMIQRVFAGKKVSDEKIDRLLDTHFDLERIAPNRDSVTVDAVQKVFNYLRSIRKRSGAPSTLVTCETFDPATQSAYSNKDARKNAAKMANAINRELARAEWLRELADRNLNYRNAFPEATKEQIEAHSSEAKTLFDQADRSDARSQAMLMELKWKMTNDPQFASRATLTARAALNRHRFNEKLNKLSIGTIRKVSAEE